MATKRLGQSLGSLASADSALSVGSGGAWVDGSSFDCQAPGGAGTPDATYLAAQFAITNAGTTDGYDLDVIVQWSDDNSNWPDDGEGSVVSNFADDTAGADLGLSAIHRIMPALRYGRFQYRNNNATDDVSVDSEVAKHTDSYET